MAEEKTQVDEQETETKDEDSYEKRYKDSQSHITTIERENATLRDAAAKDKELFDALSPYVDWDAVNGKSKTATEVVDDDGFVDRKTHDKEIKDLRTFISQQTALTNFRLLHPDMVPYEDLVTVFYGKTDPRRTVQERTEKAVELTKKLLESERTKGREELEKEKEERKAKEAEVSGLSEAKGPKGEEKEPDGETKEDYVKHRKAQSRKAQGISVQE